MLPGSWVVYWMTDFCLSWPGCDAGNSINRDREIPDNIKKRGIFTCGVSLCDDRRRLPRKYERDC